MNYLNEYENGNQVRISCNCADFKFLKQKGYLSQLCFLLIMIVLFSFTSACDTTPQKKINVECRIAIPAVSIDTTVLSFHYQYPDTNKVYFKFTGDFTVDTCYLNLIYFTNDKNKTHDTCIKIVNCKADTVVIVNNHYLYKSNFCLGSNNVFTYEHSAEKVQAVVVSKVDNDGSINKTSTLYFKLQSYYFD